MFKKYLLSLMMVMFVSSTVHANIVFNPSVFYYTREDRNGSGVTEFNQQIFNLKLGYVSPQGLYLGAAYDMESREHGSGAADTDRDSLGATIGYISNGWQILGTYYFQSDYEEEEGTGYSVDLGYVFNLGSIGIGPLLSYRHFTYDEDGSDLEHKNLLPAIQFQFTF